MKINYSKRRLYSNLISGLLLLTVGVLSLFSSKDFIFWSGFVYFILGIHHISQFFYDSKHQYLILENESIQQVRLFGAKTKIDFNEIQTIEKVDGNYILKSDTKKIKIDIDLIDNAALLKLMEVLKKADLPPEKNYFSKFKTQL
ncbi:hypothetical protein LB456_09225 [Psychroflexus sp. CAK57W]|uniref:hypothetical protein n=1 Tax=Psychroflexus curvus TaxID=2873595 RepID=UPI001CCDBD32|nr:hypothetical protein [Psychroflexus curvus]MBZ9787636.1 hypothetical protein [Psychroflexus curvus]